MAIFRLSRLREPSQPLPWLGVASLFCLVFLTACGMEQGAQFSDGVAQPSSADEAGGAGFVGGAASHAHANAEANAEANADASRVRKAGVAGEASEAAANAHASEARESLLAELAKGGGDARAALSASELAALGAEDADAWLRAHGRGGNSSAAERSHGLKKEGDDHGLAHNGLGANAEALAPGLGLGVGSGPGQRPEGWAGESPPGQNPSSSLPHSTSENSSSAQNPADQNPANQNSADQNGADQNAGNQNSGNQNSGNQNSGNQDQETPDGTGSGDNPGSAPGSSDEGQAPLYPQSFELVQAGARAVDILWVIDSSLSMAEEQAYLGANFSAFIAGLSASQHAFQTAVTTTDICFTEQPAALAERVCPFPYGGSASTHLRGSYVGQEGRRVLRHDDADLVALFNDYTQVGTNGSNFEHGLEAVKLAVNKDLSGANEKLLRDDAFLSVIVVADEDDDGVGLNRIDPFLGFNPTEEGLTAHSFTGDELIAYLEQVKGKGQFSLSTITGVLGANGKPCRSAHSQPAEAGEAYIAAAEKTGGIIQSICESDWSESLQAIGQDLSAQIAQITLPKVALKTSIEVKVDGHTFSQWSFVEGQNSIKFASDAIPTPGSAIAVTYQSLEP